MKAVFPLLAGLVVFAQTVAAETICMDRWEMHAALIEWYFAEPVAGSATGQVELWASAETGAWALLRYEADHACVLDSGEDWRGDKAVRSVMLSQSDAHGA